MHRVTVPEAARILGVTESAVRKRVQRGHIPYDKEEDGRVYVYLDTGQSRRSSGKVTDGHTSRSQEERPGQSRDRYVRSLEERNAFLEDQVKRQMDIITDLVRRVPELEAAPEPRDEPETVAEDAGGEEDRGQRAEDQTGAQEYSTIVERHAEETVRRPWWIRWFGG